MELPADLKEELPEGGSPLLLPAVTGIRSTPVGTFSELVARPDLAVGGVAAQLENTIWGAEVNYRRNLSCYPCARLEGIAGFRYLNFKEELTVTESFAVKVQSPVPVQGPDQPSNRVLLFVGSFECRVTVEPCGGGGSA